ncbi:MAG: DinB family protein [Ignavibacteria bacterium]|nr:DinB family protein [Ignavibacteria bacterium]MBT8381890.1 DinB family protein [Ignavibacteria bacterium]MBT8391068.1 DinB family protein [Ignavibacteria bacterium]NNJ54457.1 DinB family protein [Ignavibacteriaceae bacterium]NNL21854.1 DinB family protein [Ignavibacteriaceae bacterium]
MYYNHVIKNLEDNASTFKSLLKNISEEQASWKLSLEKWSLLEIVNHLYDEEREDFRQRIMNIFEDPKKDWAPIAPAEWVTKREYATRDFKTSLSKFLEERKKSIEWLKSLNSPTWKAVHNHPKLGEMSAEMLLANWLAHDYLHIRQITFMHWSYLSHITPSINLDYAGNW